MSITVDQFILSIVGTVNVPANCNGAELVSYARAKFGKHLHYNQQTNTLTIYCPHCNQSIKG